jgi:glycosyltransferase involved in cell wall biosynthesis
VSNLNTPPPFFTIGIPTYNRLSFLRQTINNLLAQNYSNFEIIIGNDYTEMPITFEDIGTDDPRIRIVNHEINLGELNNMNFLLNLSKGKYFTWQFDDDPCATNLLFEVHDAIKKYVNPKVIFTNYELIYGIREFKKTSKKKSNTISHTGREFLNNYLKGQIKALGCCGFYDIEYIKSVGSVPRLTNNHMALHSEYLMLIKAGLLSEVIYINLPLVSTRVHSNSWSIINTDSELFILAGINLIKNSLPILIDSRVASDFNENFKNLVNFVFGTVVVKSSLKNKTNFDFDINNFSNLLEREIDSLEDLNYKKNACIAFYETKKLLFRYRLKGFVKSVLPLFLLKSIHKVLHVIIKIKEFSRKSYNILINS